MEKILQYQLEQKQIYNSIQEQISQNVELHSIIQNILERVRKILKLERLIIYQINANHSFSLVNKQKKCPKNSVIYEAKSSLLIDSILGFQSQKSYFSNQWWSRYHQGFTLAVDDIEQADFPTYLVDLMHQLKVRAKVVTPIHLKEKLWGLLIAHQCSNVRIWHHEETQFLQQIAAYLESAVQQSQSYAKIQQQKEELEQQVKNQAQQIEDALVAARVASQSKHEFIGNISHELKTPLTRVIGLSSTLLHWSLEKGHIPLPIEKQQQYLKIIQESGKHLLKIINNILEFSEVQSGKNLLNIQPLSVVKLCHDVIESLQPQANISSIDLSLDIKLALKDDVFYGDQERLKEILTNLLSNGIKFTQPEGEVCLRVWQEKKRLVFEIEDTGIGMSEQQLSLLFETFTPIENFRQRIHNGVGIGLALTKHLVELHGGNIEVESALEKGSAFRVFLPTNFNKKSKHISQNIAHNLANSSVKKVVLIIRDETIAIPICQSLTAANYQVVWLIDTATAIEQIDYLNPQVVIVNRDSLAIKTDNVTDTIGAIEKSRDLKVILLHSAADTISEEYFLGNSIKEYFSTSNSLSELITKIEGII